jgi:hypothetical protein
MNWQPFSLHFKQMYAGGYRYLDRAGELMLRAENELDLMPDEAKPTGARMALPEEGLAVVIDSAQLVVSQEIVKDEGEVFRRTCSGLSALVAEIFAPRRIQSNGFASKSFWPAASVERARQMSLRFAEPSVAETGKGLGMVPCEAILDQRFASGSYELHVRLLPVTFESVRLQRVHAGARASTEALRRVERMQKKAERVGTIEPHALMLDVDLVEFDPPPDSLEAHFAELRKRERHLQETRRPG